MTHLGQVSDMDSNSCHGMTAWENRRDVLGTLKYLGTVVDVPQILFPSNFWFY